MADFWIERDSYFVLGRNSRNTDQSPVQLTSGEYLKGRAKEKQGHIHVGLSRGQTGNWQDGLLKVAWVPSLVVTPVADVGHVPVR